MCRDIIAGGRRCPCDTSQARQERRLRARGAVGYAARPPRTPMPEPALPTPPAAVETPVTPDTYVNEELQTSVVGYNTTSLIQALGYARVKEQLGDLDDISEANAAHLAKKEEQYNEVVRAEGELMSLGAKVTSLAEEKHGAPTDAEIVAIEKAEKDAVRERMEVLDAAQTAAYEARNVARAAWREAAGNPDDSLMNYKHLPEYGEYEKLDAQYDLALAETFKARRETQDKGYPLTAAAFQKRSAAYKAALEEVGVEFADGSELDVSENSDKGAMKAVSAALQYYPKSWVEASNAHTIMKGRELRVKKTKGRAHYTEGAYQKSYTTQDKFYLTRKPDDWEPTGNELHYYDAVEGNEYVDSMGVSHSYSSWGSDAGTRLWVRRDIETSYDERKPRGTGWSEVPWTDTRYNHDLGVSEKVETTRWIRQRKERTLSSQTLQAELTVSPDISPNMQDKTPGFRVALHEVAHRMESAVPEIKVRENAFLARRSGRFDTDLEKHEPLTRIYSGKKEMGYADNFANHYVGKTYPDGSTEVLSTGMEGVFGGSFGGFSGMNNATADKDQRDFVLGLLASSAKK